MNSKNSELSACSNAPPPIDETLLTKTAATESKQTVVEPPADTHTHELAKPSTCKDDVSLENSATESTSTTTGVNMKCVKTKPTDLTINSESAKGNDPLKFVSGPNSVSISNGVSGKVVTSWLNELKIPTKKESYDNRQLLLNYVQDVLEGKTKPTVQRHR